MKFDKTTIALVLSLLLNALNNTGVVPPVNSPTPPPCAACPVCPSH